jgi:hypothetical protein
MKDGEKAEERITKLEARLRRDWRSWKRRDGSPFLQFDLDRRADTSIRLRVKREREQALGWWRYEPKVDKYIFGAADDWSPTPHYYAALTENEAIRWTRSICCAPRGDLLPTGTGPLEHHKPDGLSIRMVDAETKESVTVFIRCEGVLGELEGQDVLWIDFSDLD